MRKVYLVYSFNHSNHHQTGFIYTLLHEGVHALAALVFGAKISAFEVNFLGFLLIISYVGELSNIHKGIVAWQVHFFPVD